jgi:hypothetical protein
LHPITSFFIVLMPASALPLDWGSVVKMMPMRRPSRVERLGIRLLRSGRCPSTALLVLSRLRGRRPRLVVLVWYFSFETL